MVKDGARTNKRKETGHVQGENFFIPSILLSLSIRNLNSFFVDFLRKKGVTDTIGAPPFVIPDLTYPQR
jgi:hypothetical protein